MGKELAENNLFVLLNQNIEIEPILSFLKELSSQSQESTFAFLCDRIEPWMTTQYPQIDFIRVAKSDFSLPLRSPGSDQGYLEAINLLLDRLETMNFNKIFQLGQVEWGRWIVASLTESETTYLPLKPMDPAIRLYSDLANYFSLHNKKASSQKNEVLIDLYREDELDDSLLEKLCELGAGNYPWLNFLVTAQDEIRVLEKYPGLPIATIDSLMNVCDFDRDLVTFCQKRFFAMSDCGNQALFVESESSGFSDRLFKQGQHCLSIDSLFENLDRLLLGISYWRSGRMAELSFVRGGQDVHIYHVVGDENYSYCQSTETYSEELNVVRELVQIYLAQDMIAVGAVISKKNWDPFLWRSAVGNLKYIVLQILQSHNETGRVFEGFGNDYYKMTIGHDLMEKLLVDQSGYNMIDSFVENLKSFQKFLFACEEYTDSEKIIKKFQGDPE